MPSVVSRRPGPRWPRPCFPTSRTTSGSSTPSSWFWPSASGCRIHEVPVDWVDDPDSRVDIVQTARDDLLGLARLCLGRGSGASTAAEPDPRGSDLPSSVASFARIGVVSTAVYLVLFFVLAGPLGRFGANALALALCTAANSAVHRRYTFARRGEPSARNLVLGGLAALSTSLAVTSLALAVVDGRRGGLGRGWSASVLIAGQRRGRSRALRCSAGLDVPGGHPDSG